MALEMENHLNDLEMENHMKRWIYILDRFRFLELLWKWKTISKHLEIENHFKRFGNGKPF